MKTAWIAIVLSLVALAVAIGLRGGFGPAVESHPAFAGIRTVCTACAEATHRTFDAFMAGLRNLHEKPDASDIVVTPPFQANTPCLPPGEPDPLSLSPDARREKYQTLVQAADARKKEVLQTLLRQSPEIREAFQATKKLKAATIRQQELARQYGPTDERVEAAYYEIIRLRETVRDANARFRAWKDRHPDQPTDPEQDPVYRDLIARSRLYKD